MEYGKNESWNNWSYRICGKNKKVNSNVINDCLKNGYISVIATVGVDEEGHSYNVNGDLAASAIAKALKAEKLILLTDVPGLLKEPSIDESLISEIKKEEIYTLFEDGTISGGIIMLDSAQKAKEKWYKYFMNTYVQTPMVIDSGQGSTVVDLDGKNILILQVDMEHYP